MHTHNLFFFCTIMLLTSSQTYMMQAPDLTVAKIKIPIPKYTDMVALLENNQILIAGLKGCAIVDISAPHPGTKLYHLPCVQAITDPQHPAKAIIRYRSEKDFHTIHSSVWDIKTKEQYLIPHLLSLDHHYALRFIHLDNSIISTSLINNKTTLYNYITGEQKEYTLFNNIITKHDNIVSKSITHHPTKEEVAFRNSNNEVYIYDLSTESCLRKITLSDCPFEISYSSDGSSLRVTVIPENKKLILHLIHIKSGKQTQRNFLYSDCAVWHPHHPYVVEATAEFDRDVPLKIKWWNLNYYNMKKNKIIGHDYINHQGFTGREKLFFFPNNDFIAFFTGTQYLIFNVPFDIIKEKAYPRGTRDRLIFLRVILKNYKDNNNFLLPEIVRLLLQKTMSLTKL